MSDVSKPPAADNGKPAKQGRSFKLLAPGLLSITEDGKATLYCYVRIHCDEGTLFAVTPIREPIETHHTHLTGNEEAEDSCDCRGFLRWGHCRHVQVLRAINRRASL